MAERFKLVVTDFITDELEPEREVVGDIADVVALDAYTENDLVGHVEDADALMVFHHIEITGATLQRLSKCKVIARVGVGFDNVDHVFARRVGIDVANVPDYGTEEVADSAIGMTLAMTRGFARLNSMLRDGSAPWTFMHGKPLQRLRGQVFGIVGLGRIGSATALRAKSMGMDVAFYDPYKQDGYDKSLGIRRIESLEQLIEQSYVLSIHCPRTDETRLMINRDTVRLFRKGSYLVNTARGEIVDTSVIPRAIADGRLAGAAIDVLAQEPPADDDPLLVAWRDPNHPAHDRVILAPHIAFYCEQGLIDMRTKAARTCRLAMMGQRLRNVIN